MRQKKLKHIIITSLILFASVTSAIPQNSSEPPIPSQPSSSATPATENFNIDILKINLSLEKGLYYKRLTKIQDSIITQYQSLITNHQSQITNHKSPITNHQSQNWALTALCTSAALLLNWAIYLIIK